MFREEALEYLGIYSCLIDTFASLFPMQVTTSIDVSMQILSRELLEYMASCR